MVFDNRLSVVLKAALPISTASPLGSFDEFRRGALALSCAGYLGWNRVFYWQIVGHLQILRRFLHRVETGIHGKPNTSCLWARRASGMVRLHKSWSCVWRTCLAVSAEEMIIVVTRPSFRHIMGP
ncbi:hypothetical protein SLA2020_351630 [Shorea laevis]